MKMSRSKPLEDRIQIHRNLENASGLRAPKLSRPAEAINHVCLDKSDNQESTSPVSSLSLRIKTRTEDSLPISGGMEPATGVERMMEGRDYHPWSRSYRWLAPTESLRPPSRSSHVATPGRAEAFFTTRQLEQGGVNAPCP